MTLAEVLASTSELRELIVVDADPAPELDVHETLWIRDEDECVQMTRQEGGWSASLEVCESEETPVARCERETTVREGRFELSSIVSCERALADGRGEGWGFIESDPDSGGGALELVSVSETSLHFARVFRARPRPSAVTIVEEPCLAGTRERAFTEYQELHPELTREAVEHAVLQTHSIYPNIEGRFCRRIDDWRVLVYEEGDRMSCLGADEEQRDEAVDCSRPCPENEISRQMRAVGELLSPLRLRRRVGEVTLYRSEEACLAGEVSLGDIVGDASSCTGSRGGT